MTQSCPHCGAANRDTARFCTQCAQSLRQSCPQCGASNPIRSHFCNQCGAPLAQELRCPRCGKANPGGSRFCNNCGAALSPTTPHPQSSASGPPPAATGTGQLPPRTLLAGRYIILEPTGKGGMGAVYRAGDTRIPGKVWAVKEMSDAAITNPLEKQQARTAFRQEALMLASLDHVNLPKVTDHFSDGGKQYLVMDFIEGETLADRLERASEEGEGQLPVDVVMGWAEQLCDVLEYLHSQNPPVIFRDLKPSNVMITPDGTVKLIDFGIARIFKPGKAMDTTYFGTAGYSPREQYGKGQTDARSDVYALGAMLHHLLTGVDPTDHPFKFDDVRRLNGRVPAHVANGVMKALSDDPDDRWQNIAEMRAALTQQPAPAIRPPTSRPRITPLPQPAAAAAAEAAAVPQAVPAPPASRLDLWRGLGLTLLGAALYSGGAALAADVLREYTDFPLAVFAFVPALFGALFGPWVGGSAGALGTLAWHALNEWFWPGQWGIALGSFALGMLSGLMAQDARNWKGMLGTSIVASGAYALIAPTAIGIIEGWWDDFWGLGGQFLIGALPANLLLLPLLTRWLVKPMRRLGLYRRK